jgi:hypothetical protein
VPAAGGSPLDPYVRGHAVALALTLLLLALQGPAIAALACTVFAALGALGLYLRYRGDLLAAGVKAVPWQRERLDLIVASDTRTALAMGGVVSAIVLIFSMERPNLGLAPVSAVLLGVTAAVILLSSLIDWYVILPRVSGLLGIRPCREPDRDFPRRPETWREITRWWYIHRIVAALTLRFGLSFAVAFTVSHHTAFPHGASIVAGAAVGFLASYVAAARSAVWQAGHVTLMVGRTVRRRDVHRVPKTVTLFGKQLGLPFLTNPVVGDFRPREYVYDVALEAVQLASAAKHEQEEVPCDSNGSIDYERNPTKLLVRDIDASAPQPAEPFAGCQGRCSGINWYCIENPRCFATK